MYRCTLERGSRKHICPECGKKTFVRYLDIESGEYIPEIYGRCDREVKCGYHRNPYTDKYDLITARENTAIMQPRLKRRNKPQPEGELLPIPYNVLKSTFGGYDQNIFIQNLLTNVPFPVDSKDIERVIGQYYLGTIQSDYMAGAVTFPFIDSQGRVMAIQVKQFDHNNHATRTSFLHSMIEHETKVKGEPLPEWLKIYNNNEKKVSCLFGAHLLRKYPGNPVALVEAPKSAIYGALYFGPPKKSSDLLWLAVYNLSSLTLEKCEALRGRRVILFPDLSKDGDAFKLWSQKAREHEERLNGTHFVLSDLLEKNASEEDREKGLDIADYLIRMDWRAFRPKVATPERKAVLSAAPSANMEADQIDVIETSVSLEPEISVPDNKELSFWVDRKKEWFVWPVEELVSFFETVDLPESVIQFDTGTQIADIRKFITSHINVLRANNGNPAFKPYFDRLHKLKSIIKNG